MTLLSATLASPFDNIPPELRALPNWVVFRADDVLDNETGRPKIDEETGQRKKTKVPYQTNGSKAASTRPEEWATFDLAVKAAARFDGIGFMFSGSGFAGVDLDHCVGADGVIEDWARVVIDSFASYSEISFSGSGVHIIVRGLVEEGRKYGNFEAYSAARYFTMSGRCVPGTPPHNRGPTGRADGLCRARLPQEDEGRGRPQANRLFPNEPLRYGAAGQGPRGKERGRVFPALGR